MYILKNVFDWIFPPSAETLRVRTLDYTTTEVLYNLHTYEEVVVLSSFKNTNIRALIHEAKFHNNKKAQTLLNQLVKKYIRRTNSDYDMILPVPLSKKRRRERGYNQVSAILRSHELGIPVETNILKRTKHTHPQTDLPKAARLTNMRDAFGVTHPEHIAQKHILLIDDVVTTGATLNAAKASLLPHHPASVTCLAIAH